MFGSIIMPTFSLTDPIFWLQFLYFFLTVFIAFYIPGFLILRNLVVPRVFHVALSIVTGLALFALQGYVFGFLHTRFLTYPYLLICIGIWVFQKIKKRKNPYYGKYRIGKISWSILFIGVLMQLSTIWFTGVLIGNDAHYCCGDSADNFFYGSLSGKIVYSIPPEHPGLNGELFYNYHYWSNIVIGEMSRVFGLPVFQTQFQYSTVLISVLTGILILSFIWIIGGSKSFGSWTLFFFYFGSDAIYWLIALIRSAPMFSMSSLEDGPGFLANYPRAMAVMIAFAALTLLFHVRKKVTKSGVIATVLLFSVIVGMKIYIAFFMFIGLFILAIYDFLKYKFKTTLLIGLITLIVVSPVYIQANAGAGGLYYMGFWRAQNFIVQPWLHLSRLEMARIIYEADKKWIQVMCFNLLFTGIYVISIFGTKVIALLNTKKSLKQLPTEVHYFLIPPIIISFALGFFFNQQSGDSNTFNFLVSTFIFSSLYVALIVNYYTQKKNRILSVIVPVIVVLLTIPRPLYKTYKNFTDITTDHGVIITKNILDISRIVRKYTGQNDVFLVNQIYFSGDTISPFFSILLDRPMHYSGQSVFAMVKVNPKEVERRKIASSKIFRSENIIEIAVQLKVNPVTYLIDGPKTLWESTQSATFLETVYGNKEIRIRKVLNNRIPESVFEDYAESTEASTFRFSELVAPYILESVPQKN